MTISVVTNGKIENVRCFDYLKEELGRIDPNVEIIPTGGPVRNALADIYREIYLANLRNEGLDTAKILTQIASEKDDLPSGKLLGLGSDVDALFITRHPNLKDALAKKGTDIINSALDSFGSSEGSETMRRVFFTRGDVKEYHEQIMRSELAGGSEIDHLGFSMQNRSFKHPPAPRTSSSIAEDFIRGEFHYLPPMFPNAVEDQAKSTVRGSRALTEIPFLQIHHDDQNYYIREINELDKEIANGKELSPTTREQFDKLTRNSSFSGAHNRMSRAKPGSVEEAYMKLSKTVAKKEGKTLRILPEFTDNFPVGTKARNLNGLNPELLMDPKKFIEAYTDHGNLYHGTNVANGISILRGGLYVSDNEQGLALYGRGAYTSKDFSFVGSWVGSDGLILTLPIRKEILGHINVIDLSDPKVNAGLNEIKKKAALEGRDINEVLARDHGVDVVINTHVLIQNTDVLEFPKDASDLSKSYIHHFNSNSIPKERRVSAGLTYEIFGSFRKAQGEDVKHLDWNSFFEDILSGGENLSKIHALNAVPKLKECGVNFNSKIANWTAPLKLDA